jgi:hypothetical protein
MLLSSEAVVFGGASAGSSPPWDVCQHQQCPSTAYVELCRLNKGETLLLQYLYLAVYKKSVQSGLGFGWLLNCRSVGIGWLLNCRSVGTHELQIGAATLAQQIHLPAKTVVLIAGGVLLTPNRLRRS